MKKRAFISFDYDHDLDIKQGLVGQSQNPDSPFSIQDMSIKEAIDFRWKDYARKRIRSCDVVIVLCGRYTASATGVAAEISIAQEEGIPYFLLCGRNDGNVQRPKNVRSYDKVYDWTWKNLQLLIAGNR